MGEKRPKKMSFSDIIRKSASKKSTGARLNEDTTLFAIADQVEKILNRMTPYTAETWSDASPNQPPPDNVSPDASPNVSSNQSPSTNISPDTSPNASPNQSPNKPHDEPYVSPNQSPDESPISHVSPNQSSDGPHVLPDASPNASPNPKPKRHAATNDLPDVSPYNSPDETPGDTEAVPLVGKTDSILLYCIDLCDGRPTTLRKISDATGISPNTLKSALARLKKRGLLTDHRRVNVGRQWGFSARLKHREFRLLGSYEEVEQVVRNISPNDLLIAGERENIYINKSLSYNGAVSDAVKHEVKPDSKGNGKGNGSNPEAGGNNGCSGSSGNFKGGRGKYLAPPIRENIRAPQAVPPGQTLLCKELNGKGNPKTPPGQPVSSTKKTSILDELDNLKEVYPHLANIGFSKHHAQEILKVWKRLNIPEDLIFRSLEYADFALENGLLDRVDNPLAYITVSLKRGQFGKPRGFKSRRERLAEEIARDMKEEAERIRKLNEEYFEDAFVVWWSRLPEEEKRRIDDLNRAIPKEGHFRELHRKKYFKENVFVPL